MGQQCRRPEAGEDCVAQVSQEAFLKEVTTGPPLEDQVSGAHLQEKPTA